jgi:hypothetical protein
LSLSQGQFQGQLQQSDSANASEPKKFSEDMAGCVGRVSTLARKHSVKPRPWKDLSSNGWRPVVVNHASANTFVIENPLTETAPGERVARR